MYLPADITNCTLTAAFNNGIESMHSAPFAFTKPVATIPPVNCCIHAEWTRHTAPCGKTTTGNNLYRERLLNSQTQNPSATSMDCTVSLPADTFHFTLTAAFTNGTKSPHSAPFIFTKPTSTSPQATITANVISGIAPFRLNFNGASSTGFTGSYQWNFGDGSTGTGATVAHPFTSADSRIIQLPVIDANNQSSFATTTITANAPVANTPPAAAITASESSGTAPVTFTFYGSGSIAGSGAMTSYARSFGDGTSPSGVTASHSFTSAGRYTATLTVTDNQGASDTTATSINVQDEPLTAEIEMGKIPLTGNWVRVHFTNIFENPIVVAGQLSFNETDPCVMRVHNVTPTGFIYQSGRRGLFRWHPLARDRPILGY